MCSADLNLWKSSSFAKSPCVNQSGRIGLVSVGRFRNHTHGQELRETDLSTRGQNYAAL